MKTSPSCAPMLEALEPRIAPAGLVSITTSGGVLSITGDENPNGILITHVPATGEWRITDTLGVSTYEVNGVPTAAPFNIPAQNAIKVDLKEGNDQFEFRATSAPSGLVLTGGISVKMGEGNDTLELGDLSSHVMVVGGPVVLDGGEGDDDLTVWLTGTFANSVKVLGGAGDDMVVFQGSAAEQVYQKGLTIDLGTGSNELHFLTQRISVVGALNIKMAGGESLEQKIYFSSAFFNVDRALTLAVTAGDTTIDFGNSPTDQIRLGGGLKLTTGAGDDTIRFGGQIHSAAAITLDLKNGTNFTSFTSDSKFSGSSLSIKGGLGDDAIYILSDHNLNLSSHLMLSLGAGVNGLRADGDSNLFAGSLSYTATDGLDFFEFDGENLYLTGSLTLNLGANTNTVLLTPTESIFIGGHFNYTGGTGNDAIAVASPDTRINGNWSIKAGHGDNEFAIGGAAFQVGLGFSYTGGNGNDYVALSPTEFAVAKAVTFKGGGSAVGVGADVLNIYPATGSIGSLSYTGGATGSDFLALGNTNGTSTTRFTVIGQVNFNTGAGASSLYLTDTHIHGKLTGKTATKTGEVDTVEIKQSTFHGAFNLTLGAGSSTVAIDDSFIRAAFLLNTGAGADVVNLGVLADSSSKNHWYGTVKILTGAGIDTLRIGTTVPPDANAGNVFHQNVTVDGGADTDIGIAGGNNFQAGSSLISNSFP